MPDLANTCDCALRPALQRPLYADTLSSDPPSDAHRARTGFWMVRRLLPMRLNAVSGSSCSLRLPL